APPPSIARETTSAVPEGAPAPPADPRLAMPSPASRQRRSPASSASSETARPPSMPASWTTPSRAPACTSVMARSCRTDGIAAGRSQMCSPAQIAARTTTIQRASGHREGAVRFMVAPFRLGPSRTTMASHSGLRNRGHFACDRCILNLLLCVIVLNMTSIDALDAQIILALDDDPDATILSLARTLGIARNTVHARLRRLAEDGTLKP